MASLPGSIGGGYSSEEEYDDDDDNMNVSHSTTKAPGANPTNKQPRSRRVEKLLAETGLTHNQLKLLYLVSRYATAVATEFDDDTATTATASVERWIRRVPLLVIVYEGVTKQAFDYEYSPCLERVGCGSLWLHLNTPHEAMSDMSKLCEAGLVHEMRLSSQDYTPTVAYQVSRTGARIVQQLPNKLVSQVNAAIYLMIPRNPELGKASSMQSHLFEPVFLPERGEFELRIKSTSDHGMSAGDDDSAATMFLHSTSRRSSVTDIEEISYVCSSCVPVNLQCGTFERSSLPAAFPAIAASRSEHGGAAAALDLYNEAGVPKTMTNTNGNNNNTDDDNNNNSHGGGGGRSEQQIQDDAADGLKDGSTLRSNRYVAVDVVSMLNLVKGADVQRGEVGGSGGGGGVTLDSVITAANVRILLGDWLPCGSNHIRKLVHRLGAYTHNVDRPWRIRRRVDKKNKRIREGGLKQDDDGEGEGGGGVRLISGMIDESPETFRFQHSHEHQRGGNLRLLDVYDFHPSTHVNFRARFETKSRSTSTTAFNPTATVSSAAEGEGGNGDTAGDGLSIRDTRLLEFGVSVRRTGCVVNGLDIESCNDRLKSGLAFDHLSCLLADAYSTSGRMLDQIITPQQRTALGGLYTGDAKHMRSRYVCVVCESITPRMPAERFLDRGDYEHELNKLIGTVLEGHDLNRQQVLFLGQNGMLLAGRGVRRHEDIVVTYLLLKSREKVLESAFERVVHITDVITRVKCLLANERDVNCPQRAAQLLWRARTDLADIDTALNFLEQSLIVFAGSSPAADERHAASEQRAAENQELPSGPSASGGSTTSHAVARRRLHGLLDLGSLRAHLRISVAEIRTRMNEAQRELRHCSEGSALLELALPRAVGAGTRGGDSSSGGGAAVTCAASISSGDSSLSYSRAISRSVSHAAGSLATVQWLVCGLVAFGVGDRVATIYLNIDHASKNDFNYSWVMELITVPFAWAGANIGLWAILCVIALCVSRYITRKDRRLFGPPLASAKARPLIVKLTVNRRVNARALHAYLTRKKTSFCRSIFRGKNTPRQHRRVILSDVDTDVTSLGSWWTGGGSAAPDSHVIPPGGGSHEDDGDGDKAHAGNRRSRVGEVAERRLCANVRTVAWREPRSNRRRWKGYMPKIEIAYCYYGHSETPPSVQMDTSGHTSVGSDQAYHHPSENIETKKSQSSAAAIAAAGGNNKNSLSHTNAADAMAGGSGTGAEACYLLRACIVIDNNSKGIWTKEILQDRLLAELQSNGILMRDDDFETASTLTTAEVFGRGGSRALYSREISRRRSMQKVQRNRNSVDMDK